MGRRDLVVEIDGHVPWAYHLWQGLRSEPKWGMPVKSGPASA